MRIGMRLLLGYFLLVAVAGLVRTGYFCQRS